MLECVRASPRFTRQATPLPEKHLFDLQNERHSKEFYNITKVVLQQTDTEKGGAGPY